MSETQKQREFMERRCPHCRNIVTLERVSHHVQTDHMVNEEYITWNEGNGYEMWECPACHGIELRSYFWADMIEPQDIKYKTLYPSVSKIPLGLPANIKKQFISALKVRNLDANAYGVLMRRVIEMACEDKGATGHFLNEKIKDLAAKRGNSSTLGQCGRPSSKSWERWRTFKSWRVNRERTSNS